MKDYDINNIKETFFTITILDSCGDEYDEIRGVHCPQTLIGCARKIIEMKQHDKELGSDFGIWDYRIVKHEIDDDSDWITEYKVFKYKKQWKYKVVD